MSITETIKRTIQGIASKDGAEICDPKPRSISTGIKRKPKHEDLYKRLLNAHRQEMLESQEYVDETDFDIDEPDMLTPYEKSAHVFDIEPQMLADDSQQEPATPPAEDPDQPPPVSPEEKE